VVAAVDGTVRSDNFDTSHCTSYLLLKSNIQSCGILLIAASNVQNNIYPKGNLKFPIL